MEKFSKFKSKRNPRPKWDPLTRQPRIRSNQEIRNLRQQPLITSVIRSRRLPWAGHVVRALEEKDIHKALYGRAEGRRPQGRPRMRWVDNVCQDAISQGVRDWQAAALDRRRRKDLVEAAVKLQALLYQRSKSK